MHVYVTSETSTPAALLSLFDTGMPSLHSEGSGEDVAQLVRALDRHTADAGSIPRCGKGFFSQSQLSVHTFSRCPYTPVCNRMH